MTFEAWYSSTIAPQLEQSVKPLPKVVHEQLRKASRETYVLCWNAAITNATTRVEEFFKGADNNVSGFYLAKEIEALKVKS